MKLQRAGIALMMTLFFIIGITVLLGISLSQVNKASHEVQEGSFLVQTSAVLDDLLLLLKNTKELDQITDATTFRVYMDTASFIPLPEVGGLRTKIEMNSPMGRININQFIQSARLQKAFNEYFLRYNIQDISYLDDLIIDVSGGEKDLYRTDIFDKMPWMYRERVVNKKHWDQVLDYYVKNRHDNAVKKINWDALVRFDDKNSTGIDVNYMSAEVWQLLLPDMQDDIAAELGDHLEAYEKLKDISYLDKASVKKLKDYNVTTFLPRIDVMLDLENENNQSSHVSFEYDLKTKKAYHFDFEI